MEGEEAFLVAKIFTHDESSGHLGVCCFSPLVQTESEVE